MKLRGAGWLVGTAVTITALGSVAACDDSDASSSGFGFDSGAINLPDGAGGSDAATPKDDGSVSLDAGADSGDAGPMPAQCNDGKLDLGETCDPLDKCPTDCPADGCNLRSLENGGTCAAVCTTVAVQTQCQNADGCCPSICSIANDSDCTALCGNGVKEAGEKCDGADCPTDCPPIGCQLRTLSNAGTCQAECVDSATKITQCGVAADGGSGSDQCCPTGCTSGTDPDCAAGACGNGVVDPPGETCDTGIRGSCPSTCAAQGCNLFKLDNAGTCQAACVANGTIDQCINGDGCCAKGCNNTNDSDCPAVCGNGVTEPPGETCDANCPTACPQQGCQLFTLQNQGTCTAKCAVSGTQTACVNADGCCPAGCNNANDSDCPVSAPTCGNGKLDLGETCDNSSSSPCPTCNTGVTCVGTTGSAATCDLRCDQPIGTCSGKASDACCPYATKGGADCNSSDDADCHGTAWKSVSLTSSIAFKLAGDCVTIPITNIEAGGAYDVTTCSPDGGAVGDVVIKSVVGSSIIIAPASAPTTQSTTASSSIDYGGNDNCLDSKWAVPYRAGFTCNNKDGKPTMACVAEGPGGFVARNASDLSVTLCAVGGSASVPFTVFYNAAAAPAIKF
jgi:hypothetical protein